MKTPDRSWRLALFLATSGHSGVDRIMKNLVGELGRRSIAVDLLQVEGHGPHFDRLPPSVRRIPLGAKHVNSCIPRLAWYLRTRKPSALLCDKDRVNRAAVVASRLAGYQGRLVLRVGTTVSKNLERRGLLHRQAQVFSIRRLYSRAHAVIVPSEGAAADLVRIGGFRDGFVRTVPSPVVSPELDALAGAPVDHPWFSDPSIPIVLGAGELCARKDFATLIRAFAEVRKDRECRLVILGKGRKRDELLGLAEDLRVSEHVWLPGFVGNPYAYMARASVFVLSSVCEGSPVVLMEALSLGTPVVSADCPSGPREILQAGRLGPLVPVGAHQAMAEAILRVLDSPPPRKALQEAALQFHVSRAADAYLHLLGYPGCSMGGGRENPP